MPFWSNKRILVTGGAGFLGSFVVEKLEARGCKNIFVPRSKDCDLVEMNAVRRLIAPRANTSILGRQSAEQGFWYLVPSYAIRVRNNQ